MEEWRDIPGYEGLYQVSDQGNVRSLDREVIYKNGRVCVHKGKAIKPNNNGTGYMQVQLRKNGKRETPLVHRLVAAAFLPNPEGKPEINHINANRSDNRAANLEHVTRKENMQHAVKLGNWDPKQQSEAQREAARKALSKPVLQIKSGKVVARWPSASEAARRIGGCSSAIGKCCRGELKHHRGYCWCFA